MEPPGTAPGSDPRITSAFMFIVPKDSCNIGALPGHCKWLLLKIPHFEGRGGMGHPASGVRFSVWWALTEVR